MKPKFLKMHRNVIEEIIKKKKKIKLRKYFKL